MNKIKVRFGVMTVLFSIVTVSIFSAKKDIMDITPKKTLKGVVSFREKEDINYLMEKNKDKENFDYGTIDEAIEIIGEVTKEEIEEEIKEVKNDNHEERNLHTPNRGGKLNPLSASNKTS